MSLTKSWVGWLSLLAIAAVVCALTLSRPSKEAAVCQGRSAAEWFADFVALPRSEWIWTIAPPPKPAQILAVEMEGDAVRFLARQAESGPTRWRRFYGFSYTNLPVKLQEWLPAPQPDLREPALRLLGAIGQIQKGKAWTGHPSRKTSVELAVPAIRTCLHVPALWRVACEAIEDIGPPAKGAVPDLLLVAASDYPRRATDSAIMRALEEIGPGASNAVPFLTRVVADRTIFSRALAARALGGMGAAARVGGPAVGALLAEQRDQGGIGLLTVLAHIGGAPDGAVPVLREFVRAGPPLRRELAVVALWDRDPNNPEWRERIDAALRAALGTGRSTDDSAAQDSRFLAGPLLAALGCHGTNAAIFAPAIRRLRDSKDPGNAPLTNLAGRTLERIEPGPGRNLKDHSPH